MQDSDLLHVSAALPLRKAQRPLNRAWVGSQGWSIHGEENYLWPCWETVSVRQSVARLLYRPSSCAVKQQTVACERVRQWATIRLLAITAFFVRGAGVCLGGVSFVLGGMT